MVRLTSIKISVQCIGFIADGPATPQSTTRGCIIHVVHMAMVQGMLLALTPGTALPISLSQGSE